MGSWPLRDRGIHIYRFDPDLALVLDELNREFLRQFAKEQRHELKSNVEEVENQFSSLIEQLKVENKELEKSIQDKVQELYETIRTARQNASEVVYDDNSPELDHIKYPDGNFPGSRGGVASFTDTIIMKIIAAGKRPMTLKEIIRALDEHAVLFNVRIDFAERVKSLRNNSYLVERQEDDELKYEPTLHGLKISEWH